VLSKALADPGGPCPSFKRRTIFGKTGVKTVKYYSKKQTLVPAWVGLIYKFTVAIQGGGMHKLALVVDHGPLLVARTSFNSTDKLKSEKGH
jgi:hypothetical protein